MRNLFFPNVCINFHDIYDVQWFEEAISLLGKLYNFVSLKEVYSYLYEEVPLKNSCHITFDDGDITFYRNAFPILKKYNVPVSIYVSPKITKQQCNFWFQEIIGYREEVVKDLLKNYISSKDYKSHMPVVYLFKYLTIDEIWEVISRYQKLTGTAPKPFLNMNLEQLLELKSSGLVSIGAHTQNHPILMNEDRDRSEWEIRESILQLESILGVDIINFAYPNGKYKKDFSEREMETLKKSGIKLAFSTEVDTIRKKKEIDVYKVPRIQISKGNSSFIISKLLMGSKWEVLKKTLYGKNYIGR